MSVPAHGERGDTINLMNHLLAGKLDLAFVAHIISPVSGISNLDGFQLDKYHLYPLVHDEYHTIVSRQHKFVHRDILSWEELTSERLLLLDKSYSSNAIIRDAFHQQGLSPNVAFECDQVDTLLGLVEEKFGVALLSKRVATTRYEVASVRMRSPITRDTVLVISKEVEARQRLAGEFTRHVVNYFEEAGE